MKLFYAVCLSLLLALHPLQVLAEANSGPTAIKVTPVLDKSIASAMPPYEFDSLIDQVKPGGELKVLMPNGYVTALDVKSNILAAGIAEANGATVTLTSQSTALVLVRILIGRVPQGLSASALNAAIQSAKEFPNLVALVTQAQKSGARVQNPGAMSGATIVIQQISAEPAVLAAMQAAAAQNPSAPANKAPQAQAPLNYEQWKVDKDISRCPEIDAAYNSPQIKEQFKISQELCGQADAEEKKLTELAEKIRARLVTEGLFAKGVDSVKPLVEQKQFDPAAYARASQVLEPLKPPVQSVLFEEAQAYFPPQSWKVSKIPFGNSPDYVVKIASVKKSDAQVFSYDLRFEPSVGQGVNIVLQSAMDQDSVLGQAVKLAGWRTGIKAIVELAFRDDAPVRVTTPRYDWRCFASYDQFFVRDANDLYKVCQAKGK